MVRIGPAGWAYKDWRGIVYPASKTRGFDELRFIATLFDTVEINTSFYRPVTPSSAITWLSKVEANKNFRFTAKLWRGFTHGRKTMPADRQAVKDGLGPLLEADRLGALLLQFPWSFRNTEENRAYVGRLAEQFSEYPLVLEVRHASWSEVGVLDILERLGIGLCNIDQPLFRKSVKPAAITTSPVGYVRLHGRNYKSWWTENKHVGERYDYLYSVEELDPWVDRIKAVEQSAQETYVVTNNHYLGQAVVNAVELTAILKEEKPAVPQSLVERYPELAPFTKQVGTEGQLEFPTD